MKPDMQVFCDETNDPNQRGYMRDDLQHSLEQSHINPARLSPFQRILLTTDGTVTDILEAHLQEQIRLVKLSENLGPAGEPSEHMNYDADTEILKRTVLLQGKISRKNFIYAESVIVPERLSAEFKSALIDTRTPIGKIWIELRVETFKEIKGSSIENALNKAHHFQIAPNAKLLSRTYCVFTNQLPVMMITEKFPESYFL